mmetsp:Transcript_13619/g.38781  ORF Transcript_13619/g.38781 Transcript_13619/m.38781 type:complete len:268 (+) Transcript_13619:162-965(+)
MGDVRAAPQVHRFEVIIVGVEEARLARAERAVVVHLELVLDHEDVAAAVPHEGVDHDGHEQGQRVQEREARQREADSHAAVELRELLHRDIQLALLVVVAGELEVHAHGLAGVAGLVQDQVLHHATLAAPASAVAFREFQGWDNRLIPTKAELVGDLCIFASAQQLHLHLDHLTVWLCVAEVQVFLQRVQVSEPLNDLGVIIAVRSAALEPELDLPEHVAPLEEAALHRGARRVAHVRPPDAGVRHAVLLQQLCDLLVCHRLARNVV